MSTPQLQFLLPRNLSIPALISCLRSEFHFVPQPAARLQQTFCDSFDRRLHRHRGVIEITHGKQQQDIAWRDLDSGHILARVDVVDTPHFAWDIPDSPLRKRIEPLLDKRALLPLLQVRMACRRLHLIDTEDKTRLRVSVEHYTVRNGKTDIVHHLPSWIHLTPITGYTVEANRVANYLEHELKLIPADITPHQAALACCEQTNAGQQAHQRLSLTPELRMDMAAKNMLRELLTDLSGNESGILQQLDCEFLHDFRVAIRRSRSILSRIKHIFPQRITTRFNRDFAWLNQVTGAARDLDVYLLRLPEYRTSLPEHLRDTLAPLQSSLEAQHRQQYRQLTKALKSTRYRNFLRDWRRFLDAPLPKHSRLANAMRPAKEVTVQKIHRAHRHVLRQGQAITADSPNQDLHVLRKSCKKLRYLLEMFQTLYPDRAGKLIGKLKTLQNNLGDIHDLHVQTETLRDFLTTLENQGKIHADLRRAIAWLVADLEERQGNTREAFTRHFDKFIKPATRELFRQLNETASAAA